MKHRTTRLSPTVWQYRGFEIEQEKPTDPKAPPTLWSRRYFIRTRDRRYYLHSLTEARRVIDTALDPLTTPH